MPIDEWVGCPDRFLHEIRRHPSWTLRIDAYDWRGCGLSPLVRNASITLTENDARWQLDGRGRYDYEHEWRGERISAELELTAAERAVVLAALDAPCVATEHDMDHFDIGVALGPTTDVVTNIDHGTVRDATLQSLFFDLESRYVASRIDSVRDLALDLAIAWPSGQVRAARIRHGKNGADEIWDHHLVGLADCIQQLRRDDHPVMTGLAVIDGIRLPIAVGAEQLANRACLSAYVLWQLH